MMKAIRANQSALDVLLVEFWQVEVVEGGNGDEHIDGHAEDL